MVCPSLGILDDSSFDLCLADGCDIVLEKLGINTLFDVCRYACAAKENEGGQLRMMTLGALHNMINSNGKEQNNSKKDRKCCMSLSRESGETDSR
jgi:hypothetical protein